MRNFQDTFETPKRSFISASSICMTVSLSFRNVVHTLQYRLNVSISFTIYSAVYSVNHKLSFTVHVLQVLYFTEKFAFQNAEYNLKYIKYFAVQFDADVVLYNTFMLYSTYILLRIVYT